MSWFGFGSSSSGDSSGDSPSTPKTAAETAEKLRDVHTDAKKSNESFSGFDPRGLERAAKAAKELDESKHASEALKLSFEQEKTSQMESQKDIETAKAAAAQAQVDVQRVQGDERRKTLQAKAEMDRRQAHYADQLAKNRYEENLRAQQAVRQQELKRQDAAHAVRSLRTTHTMHTSSPSTTPSCRISTYAI